MKYPKSVKIIEVGPRDGFQNVKEWIPTEKKMSIIKGLIDSNFKEIEVTSFVHPKAIPQMKDAKEIAKTCVEKYPNVRLNALVPNLFGAQAAWDAGIREVTYVISASEAHNKANINRSIEESFEELATVKQQIPELKVKLDIATFFGCPFLGNVPIEQLFKVIDSALEIEIESICLCDTIGIANPVQMGEILRAVKAKYPQQDFSLHLHDTRGMGLANVLVALTEGVTVFETAIGGLGGCPFAPGAAGNIATEDLINMLENMNINTGIDLVKLLDTANEVKESVKAKLTGHLITIA